MVKEQGKSTLSEHRHTLYAQVFRHAHARTTENILYMPYVHHSQLFQLAF